MKWVGIHHNFHYSALSECESNAHDYLGNTALLIAIDAGQMESVKILLKHSEWHLNQKNKSEETPLHVACKKGHTEILTELIHAHFDINATDDLGNTPLFYANSLSSTLLLFNGAHLNWQNDSGLSAFLFHIQQGRLDVASQFIRLPDLDFELQDAGNRNCLHFCAFRGYLEIAQEILSQTRLNLNSATRRGNTALHAAAEAGHSEMVRFLLKSGADPTLRNAQGRSAADLCRNDDIKSLLHGKLSV